jgi:hypothetical protein
MYDFEEAGYDIPDWGLVCHKCQAYVCNPIPCYRCRGLLCPDCAAIQASRTKSEKEECLCAQCYQEAAIRRLESSVHGIKHTQSDFPAIDANTVKQSKAPIFKKGTLISGSIRSPSPNTPLVESYEPSSFPLGIRVDKDVSLVNICSSG